MKPALPARLRGKAALFAIASLACALGANAEPRTDTLRVHERVQQGQLVIGHAPVGAHLEFGGHDLRTGDDGAFVFGIDRDAPARVVLKVRFADGREKLVKIEVTQREYHVERVEGLPQQTVTPNPEIAARILSEQQRVATVRKRDDEREDFRAGFSLPVAGARISGVYGSQRVDNGVAKSPHMGLDMAVPTGTPIHAPAAGIVSFADPDLVLTGGTLLIDHGFGLTSSFAHMSRIDVKVGQRVAPGDVIGAAGMTGRATGPHVHWGFNWFEVRLDPALLPKP